MTSAPPPDPPETRRRVVLAIDDSPDDLAVLERCLRARGLELLPARDARSGLERARSAQPALILLDAHLPDQGGEAALRLLRADELTRQIPVLLICASSGELAQLGELEPGALDFITRPLQEAELLARIGAQLRLRELAARQQRLEQELAEQGQAARTLRMIAYSVQHVADAMYWVDADGQILELNQAACRQLGYPGDQLLGRTIFDLRGTLTRASWRRLWARLKAEQTLIFETLYVTGDGRSLTLEVIMNCILFEGRELVCALVRDVGERKRIDAALRASERRYRALVESQVDLISRYLPDTTLTFVNDAYCQFYGKTREELIGLSFLTMVAPDFREQAWQETQSFLSDPKPVSGEYLNYTWDGRVCWIHWIIRGIVDEHGKVVEIQATGRDITPLKQADQRLKDSLHEKEVLLKELHHRVKNNLQVISSLLYLQAQQSENPALTELFRESQNRISSMTLVHEILYQSHDYARIDFTLYAQKLTTSLFSSYGVEQSRVALSVEGPEAALSINLAIPCGLIINELVSNALKHAFPDGRKGRLIVGLSQREDGVYVLDLADDGIGSPTGPLARTPTLGLRLVARLVRQLSGTLDRIAGPGTVYRITFPPDSAHP